ncbi:hypothetical protein BGW36DRAFT_353693 [Talaromyces proteolyticus]|uniref:Uncharacterized protein n=1 Tax=Talaromyces proteolyticus TaxID=1131652 RepID=A0AAD4L288_9EURO|nr:uncharacterized protein BGW36DRAFT_353693 [Talaromyces proteolyticus]KAH8705285.1 hypothetical protein BGW36DRAFT_353693 [Talaromyces proteolyticus]
MPLFAHLQNHNIAMTGRSGTSPQQGGTRRRRCLSPERLRTNRADGEFRNTWEAVDFDPNPTYMHIEYARPSRRRPPRDDAPRDNPLPPYTEQGQRERSGNDNAARGSSNRTPSAASLSTATPSTRAPIPQQSFPSNSQVRAERQARRRGIAQEPRVHISPIPEDTASTTFPFTVGGLERRVFSPLPLIPQEHAEQSQMAENMEANSSSSETHEEENEHAREEKPEASEAST